MSPRFFALIPMLALACGGELPADPAPAPSLEAASTSAPSPTTAPTDTTLPPITADDCEAVCDRIQQRCGLDTWTADGVPLFCFMRCESGKDGDAGVAAELACVAHASGCEQVLGCIDHRKLADAWMVIVAGSKDQAEARIMLKAYHEAGGPTHGAYPALLESGTIEGLNPGFWIVVAAAPGDHATANQLQSKLRGLTLQGVDTSGTYVKPVRIEHPEDLDLSTLFPASWRTIVIWQATTETSEDWAWFTDDVRRAGLAAGIPVVWGGDSLSLEIERGDELLATLDLSPWKGESVGYVFAAEGKEPVFQEHAMVGDVLQQAGFYFGVELSL